MFITIDIFLTFILRLICKKAVYCYLIGRLHICHNNVMGILAELVERKLFILVNYGRLTD